MLTALGTIHTRVQCAVRAFVHPHKHSHLSPRTHTDTRTRAASPHKHAPTHMNPPGSAVPIHRTQRHTKPHGLKHTRGSPCSSSHGRLPTITQYSQQTCLGTRNRHPLSWGPGPFHPLVAGSGTTTAWDPQQWVSWQQPLMVEGQGFDPRHGYAILVHSRAARAVGTWTRGLPRCRERPLPLCHVFARSLPLLSSVAYAVPSPPQVEKSPRSLRQKSALIQRWESGAVSNPESQE